MNIDFGLRELDLVRLDPVIFHEREPRRACSLSRQRSIVFSLEEVEQLVLERFEKMNRSEEDRVRRSDMTDDDVPSCENLGFGQFPKGMWQ